MGFSASAPMGQTGVGSATTQSANMPAPTGGKGGGFGTPTQTGFGMQQPQPQRYQPMGGNIYGYNMQRLARQMDPSATLPQQQQTYTQPGFVDYGYNVPSYGGKGGGMGGYGFGSQAPQFFGYNPFVAPTLQATAQPVTPTPTPTSSPEYLKQIEDLQRELKSSREEIFNLGEQFKDFGVGIPVSPEIGQPLPKNVTDLYQNILNRAPESADVLRYWQQRFGPTIEPEEIEQFRQAASAELAQREIDALSGTTPGSSSVGTQILVFGPDGKQYSSPAAARAAGVTNFTYEPPARSALTQGVNFQTINNQYGGVLGDVRASVDKNGIVNLTSNSNPSLKTTLPSGSYFDPNKGQIVNAQGNPISIGSQFLSSSARGSASSGIQYGDSVSDIRQEFGRAVSVTDKAKIDSKGNIQLEGGTKIPAGSYIDAAGKLRSPDGGLINIGRKDILPATSSPSPAPSSPSPAPTPAPAPSSVVSAPAPPPGSTAGDIAYRNQIINMYKNELGRVPSEQEMALIARDFGSEISSDEMQRFRAAAALERSGTPSSPSPAPAPATSTTQSRTGRSSIFRASGGIVHKGMTNRLKKMIKG